MSEGTTKRIFKVPKTDEPPAAQSPASAASDAVIDEILSQIAAQRVRSPRSESPPVPDDEPPITESYFEEPDPPASDDDSASEADADSARDTDPPADAQPEPASGIDLDGAEPASEAYFDDTVRESEPEPDAQQPEPDPPRAVWRDDKTFVALLQKAERGRRGNTASVSGLLSNIDELEQLRRRALPAEPRPETPPSVDQILESVRGSRANPPDPDDIPVFDTPDSASEPLFDRAPNLAAPIFNWKPPLDSDYVLHGQLSLDRLGAATVREEQESLREHEFLSAREELAQIPIRDFNTPRFSSQPEDGLTLDFPKEFTESSPSRDRLLSNLKRVQEAVRRRLEEEDTPTPLPGQMDLERYPSELLRASDRAQRMVARANMEQQRAAPPPREPEPAAPPPKADPPEKKNPEPNVQRRQTAVETYVSAVPAPAAPEPARKRRSYAYILFVLFTAVMLIAAIWTLLVSTGVVPAMNPVTWIRGDGETADDPDSGDELLPDPKPLVVERDGVSFVTIEGIEIILVNKTYRVPEDYGSGIVPEAQAAFDAMQAAAAGQGISLWVVSGFRSYENQRLLHERYLKDYGAEYTARMSAEAGHSEHQLGLAFDIGGTNSAMILNQSFKDSNEFKWLTEHAHEFGFILRYADGKEEQTGYMFEPWHFRYVGYDLANILRDSGLTIEEYVGLA